MSAERFDEAMKVLGERRPFKPFTIVLVSGSRYEIDYPSALAARDGAAVFLAPGGIPVIFDHESVSEFVSDLMEQQDQ
jgi:hypothetical protein